jgi:hypothetical protein
MTMDKHILALGAALGATGVEVYCVYDGLRDAPGAQLAAGVAIAILAPLVPAYIEGARRYFATIVFVFALACVIVASGSRVGAAVDHAQEQRDRAVRATKLAEESKRELETMLAEARKSATTACAVKRNKTCTDAEKRVDALLSQSVAARTTLAAAPIAAGEGDVARVAAWTGGYLSEHQVRLYLPLLWPVTMALVGAFFWGVWGDGRPPKTPPAVTLATPEAIQAPIKVAGDKPASVVALVQPSQTGSIDKFMLACVGRAKGSNLSWAELYVRYRRWCSEQSLVAIAANQFGKRLDALRADGVLRVKAKGDEVYCVDVRLVA